MTTRWLESMVAIPTASEFFLRLTQVKQNVAPQEAGPRFVELNQFATLQAK